MPAAAWPYLLTSDIVKKMAEPDNKTHKEQMSDRARAGARSVVVSARGAAIRVERFSLTDSEKESLTVDRRLSEIKLSKDDKF